MVEVPLQTVLHQALRETRLKSPAAHRPPASLHVKAASYNTICPSVFHGRCYFSQTYFAASCIFAVGLAICRTAVTTGGTALSKLEQTCQNLDACQAYYTEAVFKGYDPSLKTTDLKAMLITVILCFCYKTLKSQKEFRVLLQT